jgi:hypothetical protein
MCLIILPILISISKKFHNHWGKHNVWAQLSQIEIQSVFLKFNIIEYNTHVERYKNLNYKASRIVLYMFAQVIFTWILM